MDTSRRRDATCASRSMSNAAHNACIREFPKEVNVHGKAGRHMKLLTIEMESRLGTLWDQEECNKFCSKHKGEAMGGGEGRRTEDSVDGCE